MQPGGRYQLKWEDLPDSPTQRQIWQTATSVLIWAARNHGRSRSPEQREDLLRYARETFARKRRWLAVNQPEAAGKFYRNNHQTPTAGENWTGQLIKLANEYAYLESSDTKPDLSEMEAHEALARAETDLVYHSTTRPTKSGQTHRPRDPEETGRVMDDGRRYVTSRCGQLIPGIHMSRIPTCPACRTGVGTNQGGKSRRKGRDYISVKCPTCLAVAGEDCTGSEVHPVPSNQRFHGGREYLAKLPACPECGSHAGDPCVQEDEDLKAPHERRIQALQEPTEGEQGSREAG